jgi:hypothetical protein
MELKLNNLLNYNPSLTPSNIDHDHGAMAIAAQFVFPSYSCFHFVSLTKSIIIIVQQ